MCLLPITFPPYLKLSSEPRWTGSSTASPRLLFHQSDTSKLHSFHPTCFVIDEYIHLLCLFSRPLPFTLHRQTVHHHHHHYSLHPSPSLSFPSSFYNSLFWSLLTCLCCCSSHRTPVGLEDVSKYPMLLAAVLQESGWTDEDVGKLAGGNFLRVLRRAEQV